MYFYHKLATIISTNYYRLKILKFKKGILNNGKNNNLQRNVYHRTPLVIHNCVKHS